MPCEAVSHDRHYELSYQFFDATADAGMLVMIRDVTEAAARERAEENTRELRAILGHITRDRRGFIAFVRECERLIAQIDDGSATREVQLRDLHTLKGICAQFSMHSIAKACHLAEDAALAERAVRGAQWEDVRSRWRTMIDAVGPFRGLDGGESLEIPADEICVALAEAEAHDMAQPVVDRLRRWQLEPATIPLAGIGEWGRQLALRLDKGSIAVRVDAADCWLPRNALRPLWASLIHVVRNAIDHGLERPDERGAKPPVGVLSLRAERVDGKVRIEVSDDGRGVDWGRLRAAARARGLPAATHDDLVGALFSDGVSTAAQTTLISGRGVGMASVRATIEALGGRIEVLSVAGRETRFSFELDEAQLMLAERVPPGSPSDAASTLRVA
jgi:two-component system chemotaxis sensor kinase CheA